MNNAPEIVSIILAIAVPAGVLVAGVFAWLFKDNLSSVRSSIAQQSAEISNIKAKLGDHEIALARHGEARNGSERDLDELRSDMRDVKKELSKMNELIAGVLAHVKGRPYPTRSSGNDSP